MQDPQETQVQSLNEGDPLEEEMEAHSGILAWRIPWTEKPGRLQSMASQNTGYNWTTEHTPIRLGDQNLTHQILGVPPTASPHKDDERNLLKLF